MGKLPVYDRQVVPSAKSDEVFTLGGERSTPLSIPTLSATPGAVRSVANTLKQIDDQFKDARRVEEFSNAVIASMESNSNYLNRVKSDAKFRNMSVEDLEKDHSQYKIGLESRVLSNIKDPQTRTAISRKLREMDITTLGAVRAFGMNQQADRLRASTDQQLNVLSKSFVEGNDDAIETAISLIDGKVAADAFSRQEGQQLKERFRKDSIVGRWRLFSQANPIRALAAYESNPPDLPPQAKASLNKLIQDAADSHNTRVMVNAERAERAAKRELDTLQEAFTGNFWNAIDNQNPPSFTDLDQARRDQKISLSQFNALRAGIEGLGRNEWSTIERIERAISSGLDASGIINRAMANEELSTETAIAYMGKNRTAVSGAGPFTGQRYQVAKQLQGQLFNILTTENWNQKDANANMVVSLRLTSEMMKGRDPIVVMAEIIEARGVTQVVPPRREGISYDGPMTVRDLSEYQKELEGKFAAGSLTEDQYKGLSRQTQNAIAEVRNIMSLTASLQSLKGEAK